MLERWYAARTGTINLLKMIRPPLIVFLIPAMLVTPWFVRNIVVFGKPVIGSTLVGYNMYRQNYMLGNDNYFRFVGPNEASQAIIALVKHNPNLLGTENEAQMDVFYRSEALKIVASHPVQYVFLSAYRFLLLWFNLGVAEAYGRAPAFTFYMIVMLQGLLLATALLGSWVTGWRSWPFWLIITVVFASYMAIISELRYLILVMPLIISLSAVGVQSLRSKLCASNTE
jgi:hypothetical protein